VPQGIGPESMGVTMHTDNGSGDECVRGFIYQPMGNSSHIKEEKWMGVAGNIEIIV